MQISQMFLSGLASTGHAEMMLDSVQGCGYRITRTCEQSGEEYMRSHQTSAAEATSPLDSAPCALTWFVQTSSRRNTTTLVVELEGRWDLNLARGLSASSGGFAVAMEMSRTQSLAGIAAFYAGRTLEAVGFDYVHAGIQVGADQAALVQNVSEVYDAYLKALCRGWPEDLRWDDDTRLHTWTLQRKDGLYNPYGLDVSQETPLSRVVFGNVEAEAFCTVLQDGQALFQSASTWAWLPCQTPDSSIPYVILQRQGPLDETGIIHLARQLDCYTAGVGLSAATTPFQWILLDPQHEVQRGVGQSVLDLVQTWKHLTVTMGEEADIVRWPARLAGHPLAQTG